MAGPTEHEEGYASPQRDVEQLKADLFGIDDDEELPEPEQEQEQELDNDDDDDDNEVVAATARESDASEEDTSAKRKREVVESDEEAADGGEQKKARQTDADQRGDSDEEEFQEEEELPLDEDDPPEDGDDEVPAEPAAEVDGEVEEDVDNETAEDRDFINDEGVAAEDQYVEDGQEDEDGLPIPEAEEAEEGEEDEIEAMLKGKKRAKKGEDLGTIEREMSIFLAAMDLAAEEDMDAHRNKRPALSKLKMLRQVEDFLAKVTYHEEFLRQGGLGSLKAWLQYYEDGTLPHLRIRTSILRILDKLPINTMYEEHKQMLAKSLVGQLVMFCMKCPDEVQANQRLAKCLVEKWSKPIFEAAAAERKHLQEDDESERLEARKHRKLLERELEADKERELQARKNIKRGQPGYRIHAAIPQAAKLDYVRKPESLVATMEHNERAGKKETSRFDRKVREISRNKNAGGLKAQNVSVQGRGVYMMK